MASKRILLLIDSDRYCFPLAGYLANNAKIFSWKLKMASLFNSDVLKRLRSVPNADRFEFADLTKMAECEQAIKKSDLVIALVQDALLIQVADSCIALRKTLISPARLTRQMAMKKAEAKERDVLLLMDCGFSPGLDHIIAKKAIDNIHSKGGIISSFKTYSGVLLANDADSNPWQFRLTEPVTEVLNWGKHTNRHLIDGRLQHVPCHRLFERAESVEVRGETDIVAIPEGDSLYYKKIYDLVDADTVVKGKLLRRGFQESWRVLVRLGLTDNSSRMDLASDASYFNALDALIPASLDGSEEEKLQQYTGASVDDIVRLKWLGLFDKGQRTESQGELTPAQVLQTLLTRKLSMREHDKDCVVMQHHLAYEFREDKHEMTASLIFNGESESHSALAKVIGFTCGAAAKSVLLGTIKVKGLHIPVLREIYDPILNELEEFGIAFHMTERKQAVSAAVNT